MFVRNIVALLAHEQIFCALFSQTKMGNRVFMFGTVVDGLHVLKNDKSITL